MVETFDFFVKQISGVYPQVSGSLCRISDVRVLRFPGHAVNDLILYRIETKTSEGGEYTRVESRIKSDDNWFGLIRKPTDIDTDMLLKTCHRHFMQRILTGEIRYTLAEYLSLYKRESLYPIQLINRDKAPLEYWDTMLIRALVLKDGEYWEKSYGSVKVRQRWVVGSPEPIEPYKSGVMYNFPIPEATLAAVQDTLNKHLRHPSVFTRAKPLVGETLPIYHTRQPESGR